MKIQILKNTTYNLLGQIIPVGVAVFCMPALVANLGAERVGLLTIIWVLVGYFSILDFGLGFAVTKSVSEALAENRNDDIPELFWGAVGFQFSLAFVGAAILLLLIPGLVSNYLKITPQLTTEVRFSLYFCVMAIPLLISSSAFNGLLNAAQRFDLSVMVQLPLSVAQYLLPLICSYYSKKLHYIVAILLINRCIGICIIYWLSTGIFKNLHKRVVFNLDNLKQQLTFGGWITLSNILSPIMVYLDRFIIATALSVGVVAYYSIPMDAVMKLSAIPNSLSIVLFSVFSYYSAAEKHQATSLLRQSFRSLILIFVLPISIFIIFSGEILRLWMGLEFAQQSSLVLQILLVGIWSNSLTRLPFVYITSNGRADLITLVQVIQTPIQLLLSYFLIRNWGIVGASVAWSGRLFIEFFIYLYIAQKISQENLIRPLLNTALKPTVMMLGMIVMGLLARSCVHSISARVLIALLFLVAGLLIEWSWCLVREERGEFLRMLKSVG